MSEVPMLTKGQLATLPRAQQVELVKLLKAASLRAKERAVACYVPNPKQLEFHKEQARYRVLLGGNRSGKQRRVPGK